jgi:hypothetical protein
MSGRRSIQEGWSGIEKRKPVSAPISANLRSKVWVGHELRLSAAGWLGYSVGPLVPLRAQGIERHERRDGLHQSMHGKAELPPTALRTIRFPQLRRRVGLSFCDHLLGQKRQQQFALQPRTGTVIIVLG